VNTWHGGGAYKKVGFANYNSEKERKYWRSKMRMKFGDTTGKNVTWFISSCKAFSDVMHESYRIAYNKYLSVGMPRNDIFFRANTDLIISLKNKLNISMNTGIVLYAPTHRSNVNHSLDVMNCAINYLNIDMIINILKERFKKEFVCLFRGHPGFLSKLQCSGTINVSSYNDMQELLLIADVLITDYSSSIWDFSLTKKPCFLFTPDLDLYLSHDRGFYTPIEEWPYPFARTNEELCNNIMNFDQLKHEAKIKKHHEDLGSYEQGTATSKVTELLQKIFEKP
jgi:CDP-glycerol glycerophosphotransferase